MKLNLSQQEFDLLSNEIKIEKGLQIAHNLATCLSDNCQSIEIPDDLQNFNLLNMDVSPFPTKSRKVMKYIETEQLEKFIDKSKFVQVDNYCVVFVNSEELSYHNFENILNLDHLFNDVHFEITPKTIEQSDNVEIFQMKGSMETLRSMDKLNYYTVPLNNSQRGGKRLIFHSNQLSYALTQMIKNSNFFDKEKFSHVNNVFRLNNFAPGDKKFKAHYDTPYADKSKDQYSKYTMLIYLTGNSDDQTEQLPPLTIEDFVVKQIEENDCVIFNQKYQHEGNAYANKNKIFIRTELIYEITDFDYDEKAARMFNMACYMTKEVEQQQYSADLFNSCVKMRYGLNKQKVPLVYLAKSNLDINYVTDGNYYWFSKKIDLKSMAMFIILDYFNGKVYDLKNIKIQSKEYVRKDIEEDEESDENIFQFIETTSQQLNMKQSEINIENYQRTEHFIPNDLCDNFVVEDLTFGEGEGSCFRAGAITYFERAKDETLDKLNNILEEHSVLIFDQMITINYNKIVIQTDDQDENDFQSGKIRLSDFFINPEKRVNFASCYHTVHHKEEDVLFYTSKTMNTFCLPDISFQTFPNGIKLSIDIFNNGFVYHSTSSFEQPYTSREKLLKENKFVIGYDSENNSQEDECSDQYDYNTYDENDYEKESSEENMKKLIQMNNQEENIEDIINNDNHSVSNQQQPINSVQIEDDDIVNKQSDNNSQIIQDQQLVKALSQQSLSSHSSSKQKDNKKRGFSEKKQSFVKQKKTFE